MADISAIKLPNGSTYSIKDGRIPSAASADSGKIVGVDSTGAFDLFTFAIDSALTSAELDTVLTGSFLTRATGVEF